MADGSVGAGKLLVGLAVVPLVVLDIALALAVEVGVGQEIVGNVEVP